MPLRLCSGAGDCDSVDGTPPEGVFREIAPAATRVETETQNWTLDGVGNWATTVQDGVTKTQTINAVNEYTSFGGVGNAFDENGDYVDDGRFLYKWDFLNRLREVRLKSNGALLVQRPGSL